MKRMAVPVIAGMLVAACNNKQPPRTAAPPARSGQVAGTTAPDTRAAARDAARLGNWPVKIGNPYQVAGITYYPADDRGYVQEGSASWYGPGFHAGSTANGETYDQDDLTAAHRTLPMPSWVEVENLENGRRLTVRINDRGPFAKDRVIDLSRKAAQLLGVDRAGTARVALRRVYPEGLPRMPPQTQPAPPAPLPATLLGAVATAAPAEIAALPAASQIADNWLVQVAALGNGGRVAWLKGYLSSFGPVLTQSLPGGLTRVRLGPYGTQILASAALAQVRAAGYGDARLIPPTSAPNAFAR